MAVGDIVTIGALQVVDSSGNTKKLQQVPSRYAPDFYDYKSYTFVDNTESKYDFKWIESKIDGKKVGVLYDFFEECINNYYNLPNAIIVRLCNQGNDIILRIESDSGKDTISNKIKSKFSEYNVSVETDDEEVYYSLLLHQGGAI